MKKFQLLSFLLYCILQSFRVQSIVDKRGNDTDKAALLAFKVGLTNGANALSSWNTSTHFCEWKGVACSRKHPQRVSKLDLSMSGLSGAIFPSIGNLTFLRRINLTSNKLYGEIPSSISFLHRLEYLDLSYNSFEGKIAKGLENCSNLVHIDFSYNKLVGEIPISVGSLLTLQTLSLRSNNLTGFIPLSLKNLSSLNTIALDFNNLWGAIPEGIGFLTRLQVLQLAANGFSGVIPNSIYNLSSLVALSVTENKLEGRLPVDIGNNLPNLRSFLLAINYFVGEIPASLSNATSIQGFDIGRNNFSGLIPPELGKLSFVVFVAHHNELQATKVEEWDFLRNSTSLSWLGLNDNKLGGVFPSSIANLSTQLEKLYLGGNNLFGSIPNGIANLVNLKILSLYNNQLSGVIPERIGKLQQLQLLDLNNNMISGPIPTSIGNLTKLLYLMAYNNQIQGPIPASLANLQLLEYLNLSRNALYGTLPINIFNLSSLTIILDLSHNSLSGKIPVEVGSLKVGYLDLSQNKFSGELPETLSDCTSLEYLDLGANLFNGTIPPFLGSLKSLIWLSLSNNSFYGTIPHELSYIYGLQEMYLSHNNLSGNIPMFLQNLSSLIMLDLSFNHLEGSVPEKGIFSNITGLSISGNVGLCGGIPQLLLPICTPQHNKKIFTLRLKILIVLSSTIAFVATLIAIIFVYLKRVKSREKEATKPMLLEDSHPKVSYAELVQATDNFSYGNLFGFGRYGYVYKGTLPFKYKKTQLYAIKVFNLEVQGTSKSFLAECDALRMIRHRNLISLVTCCSSTDFKGNDFKALVFDFMPKGSLEKWLHRDEGPFLSFVERLNIIVNVADAVDYLHNNCEPSVIHCDLKPSNILLDDDLIAHVGDFGLAKLLPSFVNSQLVNSQSSIGIRGTIGYVAPEYGGGSPVSTRADVYSFGIILLEMFTCRTPTDNMFKDGLTLHTFVETAFPERLHDIMDPNLISSQSDSDLEIQNEQEGDSWNKIHEFLGSVIRVGLMCSKQTPAERKSIKDAAFELHSIRDAYVRGR